MPSHLRTMALGALALCLWGGTPSVLAQRMTYEGHQWVRVELNDSSQRARFDELTGNSWTLLACHPEEVGPLDVEVSPEEAALLDQWGFEYDVVVADLGPLVADNYEQGGVAGDFFADYHDLNAVNAEMDAYAAAYPNLVQIITLGNSLEGRPIRAMKITSTQGGANKAGIFYHGGQHAREWVTVPVAMYVADWLITNYGSDSRATQMLDRTVWTVAPVVNPDGYSYTWTNNRLWRKNRRNNGGGSYGVDLNRNWGYQWGGQGSDTNPDSEIYRGPSAFSEPETQVLRDYVLNNTNIKAYMDYHSYSQLVMYPWGYTATRPPDDAEFNQLTGQMSSLINGVHGQPYVYGPIYTTIYPASGVSVDWVYGANRPGRKIMALTIELRDRGQTGFLLPREQIRPTCEENLPAALLHAEWVSAPLGVQVDAPARVQPGEAATISATVEERNDTFSGDISLFHRYGNSGNFTETPMTLSGGAYRAQVPGGACGVTVEYYVTARSDGGSEVSVPADAPGSVLSYEITQFTIAFEDNFQTDRGWTVQSENLSDGAWQRGVPAGDGSRGDPTQDADGSGSCYLTANRAGNSDVDGGPTRMTSPVLDLGDGADYYVNYSRWFTNDDRDIDRLTVEVSNNNGANWSLVESVGHFSGWVARSFRVADYVAPSAQVRVRFSATDNPNDSVTEAGIDAFSVEASGCSGGQLDCDAIKKLKGNCKLNGTVKATVVMVSRDYGGQRVTIAANGVEHELIISGKKAVWSSCCFSGPVTISLEQPADCVDPVQADCP